jgi:sarcosine oxidase subunit beta
MIRANVLIAGGGVIGSSVAWSLARRGVDGIVVIDLDLAGIYASSELNAGGARATWWQPVNIESCLASLDFFREHREHFGLRERGYLWLFDDEEKFRRAREKMKLQNGYGLGVQALTTMEVAARFPLLDSNLHEIVGATFSPRDGLLNPNAVRAWYRTEAEALGVRFLNRHYIEGVTTSRRAAVTGPTTGKRRVESVDVVEIGGADATDEGGILRSLLTTHRLPREHARSEVRVECDALVNCLGAWSPVFSAKIGVCDVSEPVRRQISLVDVRPCEDTPDPGSDSLGMIVDASDIYFHPEGGHVLAGYSTPDEPPGFDFRYDGAEFFEAEIWPRLAHRASCFERSHHVRGWAGLYAVTPDRSGIAGAVDGFSNLFEAHSFTGRGVMQSFAIGKAVAELVDCGASSSLDITALSRTRFTDPNRWVVEDLHI